MSTLEQGILHDQFWRHVWQLVKELNMVHSNNVWHIVWYYTIITLKYGSIHVILSLYYRL